MGNKAEGSKPSRHDSYASQTEGSFNHSGGKKYNSGAKAGGGGAKRDPDGAAPAAGPKTYTTND